MLFAETDITNQSSFADRLRRMDIPGFAIPSVAYSPETDWQFGVAAAGYFNILGDSRKSYVWGDGAYSLNRQWYLNLATNLYIANRWLLSFKAGYRDYPDFYYGIGNVIDEHQTAIAYDSRRLSMSLQPQYRFGNTGWSAGVNWNLLMETTSLDSARVLMWGIGLVAQYDTRDEVYYPHEGMFFKTVASYYGQELGSTARMGEIQIDFRHFVPIYKEFIFAYQFVSQMAIGGHLPFQMLPTLGGQDLIRGVRRQMFRDNMMMALQAEFRFPIWSVVKGTVFAGMGDVYSFDDWRWTTPKIGYGLGLRASFNTAKVNVRFDVARSNVNHSWKIDGWSFYLTCTEAF